MSSIRASSRRRCRRRTLRIARSEQPFNVRRPSRGRLAAAEEVAQVAIFLASDDASYVTGA
jgi:NAD(P)-dependent dehydrogenase (short-subunit alcohol dehydrogenase family)